MSNIKIKNTFNNTLTKLKKNEAKENRYVLFRYTKQLGKICLSAAIFFTSYSYADEALPSITASPYKDVGINLDWNTFVVSSAVSGQQNDLAQDLSAQGKNSVVLAFATGECGKENWAGADGETMARANRSRLVQKKINYILSTGGAAGSFTCATDAGMKTFIQRWNSSQLVGVDFDIEAGQSQTDIENLLKRVKAMHTVFPNLKFSLTLASLAQNDGSNKARPLGAKATNSLNGQGTITMEAVKTILSWNKTEANWPSYLSVNLMAMDYGQASATNCVVGADGHCDMGQSAIQTAMNLHDFWKVPYKNISITPMIGRNDVEDEQFKLEDAPLVMQWAKQNKLAGVYYWSYDRDVGCDDEWASSTCNSMGAQYGGAYGYLKAFK